MKLSDMNAAITAGAFAVFITVLISAFLTGAGAISTGDHNSIRVLAGACAGVMVCVLIYTGMKQ